MSNKLHSAYKTIGEVVKILNNEDPKNQNKFTYIKILGNKI